MHLLLEIYWRKLNCKMKLELTVRAISFSLGFPFQLHPWAKARLFGTTDNFDDCLGEMLFSLLAVTRLSSVMTRGTLLFVTPDVEATGGTDP